MHRVRSKGWGARNIRNARMPAADAGGCRGEGDSYISGPQVAFMVAVEACMHVLMLSLCCGCFGTAVLVSLSLSSTQLLVSLSSDYHQLSCIQRVHQPRSSDLRHVLRNMYVTSFDNETVVSTLALASRVAHSAWHCSPSDSNRVRISVARERGSSVSRKQVNPCYHMLISTQCSDC